MKFERGIFCWCGLQLISGRSDDGKDPLLRVEGGPVNLSPQAARRMAKKLNAWADLEEEEPE